MTSTCKVKNDAPNLDQQGQLQPSVVTSCISLQVNSAFPSQAE